MNNSETINWRNFKDSLLKHPDLDLQFQYAGGQLVDAAYHITEIKQALITSVDCGGVLNDWTEVIVQLWVPENETKLRPMKVSKALAIIDIVEKTLPMDPDGMVRIEFGNSSFDTRQMFPDDMITDGNSLTVDLRPDAVQCKALARGGSCGTNDQDEECCAPVAMKPKLQLINLAAPGETCCVPGGGCC